MEYLHLNWDLSWPWLTLGNGFANSPNLVQWYEFTGFLGGSLWVLLMNFLLFRLAKKQNFEENNEQNLKSKKNIFVNNFKEVADLFLQKKEILLFNNLFSHVHLVSFKKGKIELYPTKDAPKDMASKVGQFLSEWTKEKWHILMTQEIKTTSIDDCR